MEFESVEAFMDIFDNYIEFDSYPSTIKFVENNTSNTRNTKINEFTKEGKVGSGDETIILYSSITHADVLTFAINEQNNKYKIISYELA